MFALRRAAAKAVLTQPIRQCSVLRPAFTAPRFQIDTLAFHRSFHQSRRWLAEEEQKKDEDQEESVDLSSQVESAKESASDAAEAVQEKAQETASDAQSTASNVVEQTKEFASQAASTIQNVASAAASTAASTAAAWNPQREPGATLDNGRVAQPGRILYIGNLAFGTTAAELEPAFTQFGRIINCTVLTDAQGMSRGFGFIEFASEQDAERAIREMDQSTFAGRRLAVQYHVRRSERRPERNNARSSNAPSKTLFIGNLSYQMSDKDLNDLFKDIRDVLDVRVAIDRRTGQPRGFAHADFVDVASAETAKVVLEQKSIYGRQLRVDYSSATANGPAS